MFSTSADQSSDSSPLCPMPAGVSHVICMMGKWSKYAMVFRSSGMKDPLIEKRLAGKSDPTKAYCKVRKTKLSELIELI